MSEIIGLDIGSKAIKLIGLKMTSQGPLLTHAGVKELSQGGEKEDLPLIAEHIKALYRKMDLKPGRVSLTVSGLGIHIQRMVVPSMPKAELKEAVRWEMKGYLPFPAESAQVDFYPLEEFEEESVKKLDLIAVACPNLLIEKTLSIAAAAGLKPAHLGAAPLALWNALRTWKEFEKEGVVALVDLGAEKASICLIKKGIFLFHRETTPAGEDITQAIMEGIITPEDPRSLYEKAERVKQEVGIPAEADRDKTVVESLSVSKVSFLIRPVLERLAAEIRRSFDYCQGQFHVERIDRLLLTGGGSQLKNIDSYLTRELGLPVKSFNPLREIPFDAQKIDPQFLERLGLMFPVALGLTLPKPKQVELLPARKPFWAGVRLEKIIPPVSLLITLLIFSWLSWNTGQQVASLTKEREAKVAKVKTLEALQWKLALLKEKENKMKQELAHFPTSLTAPVSFREALQSISHIVPDNVTLTQIFLQPTAKPVKGESLPPAGKELQVRGLAFGGDLHGLTALAQIIEGLEKSSQFTNAKLISAQENKLCNQEAAEFEIICDLYEKGQKREEKP